MSVKKSDPLRWPPAAYKNSLSPIPVCCDSCHPVLCFHEVDPFQMASIHDSLAESNLAI